jgi:tetratricopeptide (TPR) repeat protein
LALTLVTGGAANGQTTNAHLALVWNARGEALAYRKQWTEAERAHRETTRLQPDSFVNWENLADTLLAQNKLDDYRECGRQMLKRFATTKQSAAAVGVVIVFTSVPHDEQRDELIGLTKSLAPALAGSERISGALLFRAGKPAEALVQFAASTRSFRTRAWDMLFLSMIHHRLGHPFAARKWLEKARSWIAEADRVAATPTAWSDISWAEWNEEVQTRAILAEAESQLGGVPAK